MPRPAPKETTEADAIDRLHGVWPTYSRAALSRRIRHPETDEERAWAERAAADVEREG